MQARHYKTLNNMYKKPNAKPNRGDVVQLLDLEFEARRAFIDADVTKDEDRPTKIFEAYPCFKDTRNVSFLTSLFGALCVCSGCPILSLLSSCNN